MKTKFTQKADEQETKELEFDRDTITLGRHSTSDIHVVDKKASRHHAKIEIVDGEVRVTDLGSNNGTKVNGENIVTHLLTEGDEISIGATTIKVDLLDIPAVAGQSEDDPASMQRQKELKRKIDGVKSAIVADREKTVRERKSSRLIPVVAGMVVVGLIAGVILARSSISGSETARQNNAVAEAQIKLKEIKRDLNHGKLNAEKVRNYSKKYGRHFGGKDPFAEILDQIELAEQRLNEVKLAEFTRDLDIEEVREYATKLGNYLPRNKNGQDPFTVIALKHGKENPTRIPEAEFNTRLAKMRAKVGLAIRQKEYAKAIAEIEDLTANASPEQKKKIIPSFYKAKETIWKDFQTIIQEGSQLESEERYEEAKNLYAGQAPQFEGTEFHAILASRPDDLDLLVRARATERNIREAEERKEKESALARAPRKNREEQPNSPEEAKVPVVVVDTSLLKLKLTSAINAGIFSARTKFTDKRAGTPRKANQNAITLEDTSTIPWEEISNKYLFRMYSKCGLQGKDLLALAEWAHLEELHADANRTLSKYVSGKKENRPKMNETVARWRGVPVPESGYRYNSRQKIWEDDRDIAHRLAKEDAGKLAKKLTRATTTAKMEPLLEKLLAHYNNIELNWEIRDSIKALSLNALMESKKKRIEMLEKNTKKTGSFAMLRKLKMELNTRRAAAIKLIYDESIYWREDHPQWKMSPAGDATNGQNEVDALVDEVRDLWEGSGKFAAKLSPTVRSDVEIIQKINDEYLGEFGEKAGENDMKDLEEVMNNLNQIVDLKSFSLDGKERRMYEWNRRVEIYNKNVKHADITSDEKDHFVVLNDYREMMGRKRLFLEPRLCRATKKHSAVQNEAGRIWHVGSNGNPQSRAKAEGFTAGVGENVAIGYATPVDTWVRGWYRASDHHRNGLSSSWNCGGYGFVGRVGSQNFANIQPPADFPR